MTETVLDLTGLTRRFAGLLAVDGVDMAVRAGTIHAVIGPNGAGKTTLFNLISGLIPPSAGTIRLAGQEVAALSASQRAGLGLARTFQNIRVFGAMSVLENVLTGLHTRLHASLPAIVLRLGSARAEERHAVARAMAALDLVGLADRAAVPAAALSYGDQRRLEIARAMAPEPRLLLLDEPAAGMNPAEHDMGFVMGIAEHVTVLNFGRRIFDGTPAAARAAPEVIEAYLGHKVAARLAAKLA